MVEEVGKFVLKCGDVHTIMLPVHSLWMCYSEKLEDSELHELVVYCISSYRLVGMMLSPLVQGLR